MVAAPVVVLACGETARPGPPALPGTFTPADGGGRGPLFEASTASDSQPPSSDSATPEAAGEDAAQEAAVDAPMEAPAPIVCNGLVPGGPSVGETVATSAQPTAAGGTIAPGTYWLTEIDLYNVDPEAGPPTAQPVRRTFVFDATAMTVQFAEAVASADGGTGAVDTSTSSYTISNQVLSLSETCPAQGSAGNVLFTYQGGQLSLFPTSDRTEIYTPH
jgi:hypothetical protein